MTITAVRTQFVYFVDGTEFQHGRPKITGAEIMKAAGIPLEIGLLLCLPDGTQRQVTPEETFRLKHCHNFRRAPRFKRG